MLFQVLAAFGHETLDFVQRDDAEEREDPVVDIVNRHDVGYDDSEGHNNEAQSSAQHNRELI